MPDDSTETMSDTPETDAEEHAANLMPIQLGYLHLRDHARKLERERDRYRNIVEGVIAAIESAIESATGEKP